MGGVDRPTDIEIYIRGFLKQHTADQGRAVVPEAPLLVQSVLAQRVLGVLHHPVDGDDTLRDQIHALNLGNGRDVARGEGQLCTHRLAQIFTGKRGGGAAADDVLAFLGEEQRHHPVDVVAVARGTEQQIHRYAPPHLDHAGGCVISGLLCIEAVNLVYEDGGQRLGCVADLRHVFHEGDDVLPLPAEVVCHADAGVGATVAHSDEQIPLPEFDFGFVYLFAVDVHFGAGVIIIGTVPQEDDHRVVILDQLHFAVVYQMQDGEGRVSHAAHRTDRQRLGNGLHAVLQRQPLRHHGGDDLAGQRGQDACLDAAAQSVRQHDDHGILALLHHVHMVAAELLARMVDALVADFGAQIIHRKCSPSALSARSWSRLPSRPAARQSPARCASAYPPRGRQSPRSGG